MCTGPRGSPVSSDSHNAQLAPFPGVSRVLRSLEGPFLNHSLFFVLGLVSLLWVLLGPWCKTGEAGSRPLFSAVRATEAKPGGQPHSRHPSLPTASNCAMFSGKMVSQVLGQLSGDMAGNTLNTQEPIVA